MSRRSDEPFLGVVPFGREAPPWGFNAGGGGFPSGRERKRLYKIGAGAGTEERRNRGMQKDRRNRGSSKCSGRDGEGEELKSGSKSGRLTVGLLLVWSGL
ncbi:unnamed protein product [Linum tenue]|nr:unnamed protein product [Linum tenue]